MRSRHLLAVFLLGGSLATGCGTEDPASAENWTAAAANAATRVEDSAPSLFPSIRTFYIVNDSSHTKIDPENPESETALAWMETHADMGLAKWKGANVSLAYVSWGDSGGIDQLESLCDHFDEQGVPFDNAFLHYSQDVSIPSSVASARCTGQQRVTAMKEDRFSQVLLFSDRVYTNVTEAAFGEIGPPPKKCEDPYAEPVLTHIPLPDVTDDYLLIGHYWPFNEMNFNVTSAANHWGGEWQYATGESLWSTLPLLTDGTGNFQNEGQGKLTFHAPANWMKSEQNGKRRYWLRFLISAGLTTPIAAPVLTSSVSIKDTYEWLGVSAVSGHKYLRAQDATGKTYLVVPGWNPAGPPRHGASAQFKYQSRVPASYFSNRWLTNLGNRNFQDRIGELSKQAMNDSGADGVFVDNSVGDIRDYFKGAKPIAELLPRASPPPGEKTQNAQNVRRAAHMAASLAAIKTAINDPLAAPAHPVFTNGTLYNSNESSRTAIMNAVDGTFHEGAITYVNQDTKDSPKGVESFFALIQAYSSKQIVVHANPNPNLVGNPDYQKPPNEYRDKMYALARYYLTSAANTLFDYQDSSDYKKPWSNWFEAIKTDIGVPTGPFTYLNNENASPDPSTNRLNDSSFDFPVGTTFPQLSVPKGVWSTWPFPSNSPILYDFCTVSELGSTGSASDHSLEIDQTVSGATQCRVVQRSVDLVAGRTYTLQGWVKHTPGIQPTLMVNFPDAQQIFYAGLAPGNPDAVGVWQKVQTVFVAPASTTRGSTVYAYTKDTGVGQCWFDDIGLYEGNWVPNIVFKRTFEKGMVILRPSKRPVRSNSDPVDTTTIDVPLEGDYCRVNADGSIGAILQSVPLAEFEGAVLIGASFSGPNGQKCE